MKKIFYWLIDKWLGGFLTAVFIFIITKYYELPEESRSNFFNFKWISEIFNISISLWVVCIMVIVLIIITRIEKNIFISKFYSGDDDYLKAPKNPEEDYKSDVFGVSNSRWTWNYIWRADNQKFEIINLKPSCPDCDTPMAIRNRDPFSPTNATCHKCRLEGKNPYYDIPEQIGDIDKEIIRRIVNKETGT